MSRILLQKEPHKSVPARAFELFCERCVVLPIYFLVDCPRTLHGTYITRHIDNWDSFRGKVGADGGGIVVLADVCLKIETLWLKHLDIHFVFDVT